MNVVAVLKPAYDYKIEFLVDKACDVLRKRYPSSLDQFDEQWQDYSDTLGILVINLAREIQQISSILPAAFYLCCARDPAYIVHGFCHPDYTMEYLSKDDISTYVRGRARLIQANVHLLRFFLGLKENQSPECRDKKCIAGLEQLARVALDTEMFSSPTALLDSWPWIKKTVEESRNQKDGEITICAKCLEHMQTRVVEHRQEVWKNLTQTFGL